MRSAPTALAQLGGAHFLASRPAPHFTSGTEQALAAKSPTSGPGRVVVTIAVEGLRIPAVSVELRNVDGNVVIAQTTSDAIGQVTFPDVPAGPLRRSAPSAKDLPTPSRRRSRSSGGATEQVLVEMRLTFVRESVDVVVPANSPTESLQPVAVSDVLTGAKMDIQPLAGDDFQSLLTVLPSIIRGPEGRLRVKGGAPTTGALQMSSASLNDPVDRRLRSRAAERRRRIGRGACRIHSPRNTAASRRASRRSAPSAARNEWLFKPDNLVPGLRQGLRVRQQVRAAARRSRDRSSATACCSASTCSTAIVADAGQESAGRATARARQLRLVHAARRGRSRRVMR